MVKVTKNPLYYLKNTGQITRDLKKQIVLKSVMYPLEGII